MGSGRDLLILVRSLLISVVYSLLDLVNYLIKRIFFLVVGGFVHFGKDGFAFWVCQNKPRLMTMALLTEPSMGIARVRLA